MDDRPWAVDFYCCAGGTSMGYHQAGLRMVGVDKDPQRHYPFAFVQADAITLLDWAVKHYSGQP